MIERRKRVLLIQMPFAVVYRPSIALSLLRAVLEENGFPCDILYLNHDFAARIGLDLYERIADQLPQQLQIGELAFAPTVFPAAQASECINPALQMMPPDIRQVLPQLSQAAEVFIQAALQSVSWSSYRLVGFGNMFQQIVPCLSLARRIRSLPNSPAIILGGANCEGEMGETLHRWFPWIDFICQGEGERLIVELMRYLCFGQGGLAEIGGLIWRNGERSVVNDNNHALVDLNKLPLPQYEDWLAQLRCRADLRLDPRRLMLPIETSRGCWYGAKIHCTFCGLNGGTLAFRSKSAVRALQEFENIKPYGISSIYCVDNILDHRYYKTMLPALAEMKHGMHIFWEIKSNLSRWQIKLLRDAGVTLIQPGIESLSTDVLKLMRKGVTALQNVRLLKWCVEFGVHILWHLLYGFPGEKAEAYEQMACLVRSLTHLPPPKYGCTLVFLERFSPMYKEPGAHGITRVRAAPAYGVVFPLPDDELNRLAYYFDADFVEPQNPESYIASLRREVTIWQRVSGRVTLQFADHDGELAVLDTRPVAITREALLQGPEREIFLTCEDGIQMTKLYEQVDADRPKIDRIVNNLLERCWLVLLDGQLLNIAVRTTPRPVQQPPAIIASTRALPLMAALQ